MSTFDSSLVHLSARAVEWLRGKTWRLERYTQPGGLPVCWGTMHPNRGLKPPPSIWEKIDKAALRRGLLRWHGRQGHFAEWLFSRTTPFAWTEHMAQVADARALVRARTKGASGKRYSANPFGGPVEVSDVRMPTCADCAVIFDEELAATEQRWEFPDDWRERLHAPRVLELVDPKTGVAERIVFDATVENESEDDPENDGTPLIDPPTSFG